MHRNEVAYNLKRLCAKKQPSLQFISLGSDLLFDGFWLTIQLKFLAVADLCLRKAAWLQEASGSPPRH